MATPYTKKQFVISRFVLLYLTLGLETVICKILELINPHDFYSGISRLSVKCMIIVLSIEIIINSFILYAFNNCSYNKAKIISMVTLVLVPCWGGTLIRILLKKNNANIMRYLDDAWIEGVFVCAAILISALLMLFNIRKWNVKEF